MLPQASPPGDDDALELRDYLAVLRRRRAIVAVTTAATVALALLVSFIQTPVYEASTTVLLQARDSEELFSPDAEGAVRVDPARVATEIGVMESRSVRDAVAEALGRPVGADFVDIQPDGETDLVTITAESTEPAEAARIADTYAEVYIETRRQQQVADLQTAIDQVQAKITEIGAQLDRVDQPLADLEAQIARAGGAERQELEAQRSGLEERIESLSDDIESQRAPYIAQLDRLQLAINLTQTGGAEIVSRALEPTSPVRPDPVRNAALALVVGLILGVGLAFLRDHLDDTVKTKDDLQAATGGATVLGLIPSVPNWKDRATTLVVSVTEPKSAAAEAYRSLRTSVQFIGLDNPMKVIQFTSPNASEGKSTTLANLAVALANAGQRVVVVCCDLRRPRIHEFLGVSNDTGFTSVLLGEMPLSAALQAARGQKTLAVLASGPMPPNPSELLASQRVKELFDLLRAESDVILVDSPPVLPVTDSLVVSRVVDATIVVSIANRTTRHEAQRALELLNQVGAPVVGTVLNGVEPSGVYGYGSTYAYAQAEADKQPVPGNGGPGGPGGLVETNGRKVDHNGAESQPPAKKRRTREQRRAEAVPGDER